MIKLYTFIILAIIAFSGCSINQTKNKPNILFIMADDHAAQAIGAYGGLYSELNPTPNIDQLAQEGILFKNAFCTNSICTPSRAAILTGQYPQTNGVLDLDDSLDIKKQYLPQELKKLGYATAIIGKWHLKNEPKNFDYYKVLPKQGDYFDPAFMVKNKGEWPKNIVKSQGHSSNVITNSVIDYLKTRDKTKPFFLMHHFKAPHGKFEYAPRYNTYLKGVKIPQPASLYPQPEYGSVATRGKNDSLIHMIGSSVSSRNTYSNYVDEYVQETYPYEKTKTTRAYQAYLKKYLRCVKGIDDNLGRLFAFLKKEGLWENTIIVYTSDQGFMLGAHDYKDKRWMYDESMRMPFIVHYPEMIKKGEVSDLLINNTDFAPTLIELAGGKTPDYMQGKSFIKTIKGDKETDWRSATYYRYWMHMIHHYVPAHFGIRTKDFKLIFYYSKHYLPKENHSNFYWNKKYGDIIDMDLPVAWEFYDLKNDPNEMHNQYNNPDYKDIIDSLKLELKQCRLELNEEDKAFPNIKQVVDSNWE